MAMFLIQFLLPTRDNDGHAFPRASFEQVRTELTEKFGGVTAFLQAPAAGAWKEEQGEPIEREDLVLFEVMSDDLDRTFWERYRRTLEARFRQKEIVVRAIAAERL